MLLRIAGGDKVAFKIIYDKYWNTIYTTALSYLKSPEWAQDLVQDIFLKLWIKREKLPEVEKFDAFFFVMARNEILDALKTKFQSSIPIDQKYEDILPADILSPDAMINLKEYEGIINKAVDQLPEQQKKIFKLTRQQGLSHEQISKELGITRRTVSNHMTKALNSIRQFLKDNADSRFILLLLAGILSVWCLCK